jgi:anti-anti-sigma factor
MIGSVRTGVAGMMLETEVFRLEPGITVLACAGKFTMGTRLSETEALSNKMVADGVRKLILDLTHADAVDSAGLGVIMHMYALLEQAGGQFRICGANERIKHLLSVTHTDTLLTHDADLESSVAMLGGDPGNAASSG